MISRASVALRAKAFSTSTGLPAAVASDGLRPVLRVGRRDVDDVDVRVGDEVGVGAVGRGDAELVGEGLRPVQSAGGHRLELLAGGRAQGGGEGVGDAARRQDPPAQCRGVVRIRGAGGGQRQRRHRPIIDGRRAMRTVRPIRCRRGTASRITGSAIPRAVGGRGLGTASASVNGRPEPSARTSAPPSSTVLGKAPRHAADDGPQQERLTRPDQHEVAEPSPLPDVDLGDGDGVGQVLGQPGQHPGRVPVVGLVGGVHGQHPARPQHARHVGEPLGAGQVGRHLALGIRVDDDGVSARVLERSDALAPRLGTHPDPVAPGERQLAAHLLGERGVRLEDDLRRPGSGRLDVAGQRHRRAPDVGHRDGPSGSESRTAPRCWT